MICRKWFSTVLLLAIGTLAMATSLRQKDDESKAHRSLNVVVLGDSNTSIGGDDCSQGRGWTTWFVARFAPASCRSYARSGATWTNTPQTRRNTEEYTELLGDDNVIYNQIERLRDAYANGSQVAPQIIIIAAGTNDAWFARQRPQAFLDAPLETNAGGQPCKVLTLAGSVGYGCRLLRELFPGVRIVLLTPMETTAAPTIRIRHAGDIIERCGHELGATVVRMDRESCVRADSERRKKRFTTDGTHTSEEGARRNGFLIADFVSRMVCP